MLKIFCVFIPGRFVPTSCRVLKGKKMKGWICPYCLELHYSYVLYGYQKYDQLRPRVIQLKKSHERLLDLPPMSNCSRLVGKQM